MADINSVCVVCADYLVRIYKDEIPQSQLEQRMGQNGQEFWISFPFFEVCRDALFLIFLL